MGAVVFLVIYAILLIVMVIFEVYILSNDKSKYLNISYKSLKTICERLCVENTTSSSKELANELNRFYNEYTQEMPQLKRFYSNVVIWIDAIIFRIDSGNQKANVATVYKGNIIKNLIMDCQSYTKYRPNETTGGIFVSWRRKEELPTGA